MSPTGCHPRRLVQRVSVTGQQLWGHTTFIELQSKLFRRRSGE
jgi:hypothetical protein